MADETDKQNREDGSPHAKIRRVDTDKYAEQSFIYNMNHPKRGMAVIINNKIFKKNLSVRNGTDVDADDMETRLKTMGFEVSMHHNKTGMEMRQITEDAAKQDHSKCDAFVLVVLSHGNEKGVFGIDDVVGIDKLIKPFKGDRCSTLIGKPKLFFIQACRGDKLCGGVPVPEAEADADDAMKKKQTIPIDADIMVAYSVVPGHYSWRNIVKGSWFIQALKEVLEKYGDKKEILWMMTRVNGKVALDYEADVGNPKYDGSKQMPAFTSMLTKELYFTPK